MRTLTKLLLMVGLALTVGTSAGATVSVTLTYAGGSCTMLTATSCQAVAGDTLTLNILYSLGAGDHVTLVDPALVWNGSVQSFTGGTETAFAAWSAGAVALNPIATGDITEAGHPGLADGWEKATTIAGGAGSPCVFGACTSLGTATFVLTGNPGVVAVGAVGMPFGSVIGDGNFNDITGLSILGTFTIVPEPTTASLLGLGLLGLTIAGRRRMN